MPSESIDYRLSVCQSIEDNWSLTIPDLVMNILAAIVAGDGLIIMLILDEHLLSRKLK